MRKWAIRLFLEITAIESLILAGSIYGQRSSSREYFLSTGFSAENFLLFTSAVVITLVSIGVLYIFHKNPKLVLQFKAFLDNDYWFLGIVAGSILILVESVQNIIFLNSNNPPPHYSNYIILLLFLLPYMVFGIVFSIQTLILVFTLRTKNNPINHLFKSIDLSLILTYLGILAAFILFEKSKYGFIPFSTRYEVIREYGRLVPTAAPIIGEQVFIIFVLLLLFSLILRYLSKNWQLTKNKKIYFEWLILISIWGFAYLLWMNVPLRSNYFTYVSGTLENIIYPISDAFYFDREALSIINNGEFLPKTTHVLYSYFLAILHKFSGPGYIDIIGYQIAVLAITPVLVYKLTSKIHTKFSGILVAVLFIVRERNGLMLSDTLNGTYVSMLMSEAFGLLGAVGFLYFLIDWLKQKESKKWLPSLAGGVIGAALLIRAELLTILISGSFCALIYLWKDKKRWIHGMIQIWMVAGVIIIPWMTRNYQTTGVFTLDKGNYVQSRLMNSYVENIQNQFNNGDQEESDNQNSGSRGFYPGLKTIPNQFISSTLQSILYLPSGHQPLFTFPSLSPWLFKNYQNASGIFSEKYVERYVRSLPYFSNYWDGGIELRSVLSIGSVLLFISIGLWYTWKKDSTIALILPVAMFSHMFLWAAAGFSGGRFIKPSDWMTLIFYGIGLTEASYFIIRKLKLFNYEIPTLLGKIRSEDEVGSKLNTIWIVMISTGFMVLLGIAPVISEILLPAKFTEISMNNTLLTISQENQGEISTLNECYIAEINNSSLSILYGKAAYPRYFEMGEALEDDRSRSLPDSSKSRLEFFIVGQQNIWSALPLDELPKSLPHYSDVIVLGNTLRDTEEDLKARYQPYFQTESIYTLEQREEGWTINKISNTGSGCDLTLTDHKSD